MAEGQVYISDIFKPYLSNESIQAYPDKVKRNKIRFERILAPVEPWIMMLQSLLVWEKPYRSAALLVAANVGFWLVSCYYHKIITVIAWSILSISLVYIWKTEVWPVIRVPSPLKDQDDWIPMHANLMSVPELSQYLAEYFVTIRLYGRALRNLRAKRKSAFLVLMWLVSILLMIIGHVISGFTLSYILGMTALIWPCAVYHKIFPRLYLNVEPYLMKLQYNLKQKLGRSKIHKKIKDSHGDTAETESEDEAVASDLPAADAALYEALARSITDSEDESPVVSVKESSGHSYNKGISHLDVDREEPTVMETLVPDVSLMPDFEQICDESNTFMLETEMMPSIDDIDHSRLVPAYQQHYQDDTGSETESIPYDDELHTPHLMMPENRQSLSLAAAPPTTLTEEKQPGLQEQAVSLASSVMSNLISNQMATSLIGGLSQRLAGNRDSLLIDPRDRIADASVDADDSDSLDDFEFLSKDELNLQQNQS